MLRRPHVLMTASLISISGITRLNKSLKKANFFVFVFDLYYLCSSICITLNFDIMNDIIKKDDLRAFIQSKIYVIRGINLAELQVEHRKQSDRKPIGFIQPEKEGNDTK